MHAPSLAAWATGVPELGSLLCGDHGQTWLCNFKRGIPAVEYILRKSDFVACCVWCALLAVLHLEAARAPSCSLLHVVAQRASSPQ